MKSIILRRCDGARSAPLLLAPLVLTGLSLLLLGDKVMEDIPEVSALRQSRLLLGAGSAAPVS